VLRTSNLNGAGTNADVEFQLEGTNGTSNWIVLDNPGDDREKGDVDIYFININDVGDPNRVKLRTREESASPDAPDWHLDRVSVRRGQVPDGVKAFLSIPLGDAQYKRRKFEDAFRALPDTKVYTYDNWIIPGKFANRGTPNEWVVVQMP
jgi:hypothetical protein